MEEQKIALFQNIFDSRLSTLKHLLDKAQTHFSDDELFLQKRLAPDMLPFGTQVAFTCNQPRNFALWCSSQAMDNLDPNVASISQAYEQIAETKKLLAGAAANDSKLDEMTKIDIGEGLYLELSGLAYVNEFLLPNFYFHLVTAYDILRMAGVALGKRDYMMHVVPFVKNSESS